jgi:hypothetical protein
MPDLVQLDRGEAALFGYGSLLLKTSMERTLGRPYDRQRFVCHVKGWRRTWDSIYPNQRYYYLDGSGGKVYPKNILYLNISRSATTMNGVVYVISDSDLAGFDNREAVYDRVDIRGQVTGIEVKGGPVWAYAGKPEFLLTQPVSAAEAAIRRGYIDIVERGLSELGAAFTADYRASTDPAPEANIVDDRID